MHLEECVFAKKKARPCSAASNTELVLQQSMSAALEEASEQAWCCTGRREGIGSFELLSFFLAMNFMQCLRKQCNKQTVNYQRN